MLTITLSAKAQKARELLKKYLDLTSEINEFTTACSDGEWIGSAPQSLQQILAIETLNAMDGLPAPSPDSRYEPTKSADDAHARSFFGRDEIPSGGHVSWNVPVTMGGLKSLQEVVESLKQMLRPK
jgi:hypothetical protein